MNQVKFTVQEAIANLEKYDKDAILYCDVWHPEDVQTQANTTVKIGETKQLTTKEIIEVFSLIQRSHDATIGINWDVIDCALDTLNLR